VEGAATDAPVRPPDELAGTVRPRVSYPGPSSLTFTPIERSHSR
jgi:hypothetical protein